MEPGQTDASQKDRYPNDAFADFDDLERLAMISGIKPLVDELLEDYGVDRISALPSDAQRRTVTLKERWYKANALVRHEVANSWDVASAAASSYHTIEPQMFTEDFLKTGYFYESDGKICYFDDVTQDSLREFRRKDQEKRVRECVRIDDASVDAGTYLIGTVGVAAVFFAALTGAFLGFDGIDPDSDYYSAFISLTLAVMGIDAAVAIVLVGLAVRMLIAKYRRENPLNMWNAIIETPVMICLKILFLSSILMFVCIHLYVSMALEGRTSTENLNAIAGVLDAIGVVFVFACGGIWWILHRYIKNLRKVLG